jgi:hypothetical protein
MIWGRFQHFQVLTIVIEIKALEVEAYGVETRVQQER